jgi:hypothetical protein
MVKRHMADSDLHLAGRGSGGLLHCDKAKVPVAKKLKRAHVEDSSCCGTVV